MIRLQSLLALVFLLSASADEQSKAHVLFMIGEREYLTKETLPAFAKQDLEPLGFRVTIVNADEKDPNYFPGLEALKDADLLFLSVRRRTLSEAQMMLIKNHLKAGKGLVGIRTASHAFSLRDPATPAGHVQWPDFDTEVLGFKYDGHYQNKQGSEISPTAEAANSPLLKGLEAETFHSPGTLYISKDVSTDTSILMTGSCTEKDELKTEPVAFQRTHQGSRIFYTSLGHPEDFKQASFRLLLVNAVNWATKNDPTKP